MNSSLRFEWAIDKIKMIEKQLNDPSGSAGDKYMWHMALVNLGERISAIAKRDAEMLQEYEVKRLESLEAQKGKGK